MVKTAPGSALKLSNHWLAVAEGTKLVISGSSGVVPLSTSETTWADAAGWLEATPAGCPA